MTGSVRTGWTQLQWQAAQPLSASHSSGSCLRHSLARCAELRSTWLSPGLRPLRQPVWDADRLPAQDSETW